MFSTIVRRAVLCFLIVLGVALVQTDFRVHAQNAGNVGIYTKEIAVFSAQTSTKSSPIFPDFGFGCNDLVYQTAGFSGTITLEWNPPGTSNYYVLTQANYAISNPDTASHVLALNGYYPNLRSTVMPAAGSVSAWYTAQAGPCSFASPALGSNGASSPISCDLTAFQAVAPGAQVQMAAPVLTGDTLVICGFSWSFNGPTSLGNITLWWANPSPGCSGSASTVAWIGYATASTPQTFAIPFGARTPSPASLPLLCAANGAGTSALLVISYASVHNL